MLNKNEVVMLIRDNLWIMNSFEKLRIEYGGIAGTINAVSSDPVSKNYLEQLDYAIKTGNYNMIVYILTELEKWYKEQYHTFASQSTYPIHERVIELIRTINDSLKEEDCYSSSIFIERQEKTVFLSHKSDDKKYGDALRNFLVGLGVKDSQLIYSSHPMNKVPLGENIYDYLRAHISSSVFMIILWSDKYLESPACLNEMGAAWVVQAEYTNVYVPDFSFGNPKYHQCAIDTSKMGAVLNGDIHCRESMIELKDKIQHFFGLANDEKKSNYLLETFISEIT